MDGTMMGRDLITIEVEMLRALYPEEEGLLKIDNYFDSEDFQEGKPLKVYITISPSTGLDDSSQFISLQICFNISNLDEYPSCLLKEVGNSRKGSSENQNYFISIPWRRGLSEVQCNYMLSYLYKKAHQLISESEDFSCSPPIYNLLEEAREYLTNENARQLEVSRCSVCLDGFSGDEPFIKLPCYHIFHTNCLKTWFYHKCRDRYDRYLVLMDRDDRGVTNGGEETPTQMENEPLSGSDSPIVFDASWKENILNHDSIFTCPICLVPIPVSVVEQQLDTKKDDIIDQYRKEKRKEDQDRKKELKRLLALQELQKPQPPPQPKPVPVIVKDIPKKKKEQKGGWNGKSELYGVEIEGLTYSNNSNNIGVKQKEKVFTDLKEVARVRMTNMGTTTGRGPRKITLLAEFISLELAEKFQREYNNKSIYDETVTCSLATIQPTTASIEKNKPSATTTSKNSSVENPKKQEK